MQVLEQQDRLGVRVAVVAFADSQTLARYQGSLGLDHVPVLADPERATYAAFGFGRASVARVWLDPRVWWRYARLRARGRRPQPAREDTLQLGGDVLVDARGRVTWIHAGRGPEDRPTVARIEAALMESP